MPTLIAAFPASPPPLSPEAHGRRSRAPPGQNAAADRGLTTVAITEATAAADRPEHSDPRNQSREP